MLLSDWLEVVSLPSKCVVYVNILLIEKGQINLFIPTLAIVS